MITYTCTYDFGGKKHSIHVMALNEIEASQRLRAIGMTAQIDGELIYEASLYPATILERLRRMISKWKTR